MRPSDSRFATIEMWTGVFVAILLVASEYFVWNIRSESIEHEILEVSRLARPVAIGSLILGAVLFLTGIRRIVARESRGWLFFVLSAVNTFLVGLGLGLNGLGSHEHLATVNDSKGREYRLVRWSGPEGGDFGLVRLESRTFGYDRFRILVEGPAKYVGDGATADFLSMVRPTGSSAQGFGFFGGRYFVEAPDGRRAVLAYDVLTDRAYSASCLAGLAGEDHPACVPMSKLSPFVLLGRNDTPREDDFEKLSDLKSKGRPDLEAIEAELQNPNPRVREMAGKLIQSLRGNLNAGGGK